MSAQPMRILQHSVFGTFLLLKKIFVGAQCTSLTLLFWSVISITRKNKALPLVGYSLTSFMPCAKFRSQKCDQEKSKLNRLDG